MEYRTRCCDGKLPGPINLAPEPYVQDGLEGFIKCLTQVMFRKTKRHVHVQIMFNKTSRYVHTKWGANRTCKVA